MMSIDALQDLLGEKKDLEEIWEKIVVDGTEHRADDELIIKGLKEELEELKDELEDMRYHDF